MTLRSPAVVAALVIAPAIVAAACAPPATGALTSEKSHMTTPPSTSRAPAPDVAPVEHAGVRYEQDRTDERQGDQDGGYLAAIDAKSGARLWRLKVYDVPDNRAAGVSGGGLYFRSMRLGPGGTTIEIENEAGGRYLVDLVRRTSAQVGGPPPTAPAPPPKPKPKPQ